jgi:hypothetical protein
MGGYLAYPDQDLSSISAWAYTLAPAVMLLYPRHRGQRRQDSRNTLLAIPTTCESASRMTPRFMR